MVLTVEINDALFCFQFLVGIGMEQESGNHAFQIFWNQNHNWKEKFAALGITGRNAK